MSFLSNILSIVMGVVGPKVPPGFEEFVRVASPMLLEHFEHYNEPVQPGVIRPTALEALKNGLDRQRHINDVALHAKHHPEEAPKP